MRFLGIESSCDETAAAVVDNGRVPLSNVIQSQVDIHKMYGGVVPEVAARSHIEVILPVIDEAMKKAHSTWNDIDAIAVSYAPGLVGSLLIGVTTAKTLALLKNKPLYPVHHVLGHVYANFLLPTPPPFPILALIVSGLHSQLVLFYDHDSYELLGQTQDDAVGEAFDKVARMLGLPYPGGPSIAKAAAAGDPFAFKLPKARVAGDYDFSFSGLKTAVLRTLQASIGEDYSFPSHQLPTRLDEATKHNMAASFQHTAIETLVDKTEKAFQAYSPASVVIAGGVAANQELRLQLSKRLPISIDYPDVSLCTDNAAMIATLGFYHSQRHPATNPHLVEAAPSLSMYLNPKTPHLVAKQDS
ncbi:MAG TPA: tRNA (adenosine(37)-N6)-threonylcarbamoyltransferase complex transferase subunit TsaD [Candidatus Saccharimonadales bacterium]